MAPRTREGLDRARKTLLANPRVPVFLLAEAAGFLRVEPFESAYFKAFGERPSDTRLRGSTAPLTPPDAAFLPPPEARWRLLSPRERQVSALIGRGLLNKQVAAELGITERTVLEHRGRALRKLGVGSAAELARLLERLGQ